MRTAAEKILKYLQGRKRPVTVEHLVNHFLTHPSTVRSALHDLKTRDLADFDTEAGKAGRAQQLWYSRRPVALPSVSAPIAPAPHRPRAPRSWTVYDERAYD